MARLPGGAGGAPAVAPAPGTHRDPAAIQPCGVGRRELEMPWGCCGAAVGRCLWNLKVAGTWERWHWVALN